MPMVLLGMVMLRQRRERIGSGKEWRGKKR